MKMLLLAALAFAAKPDWVDGPSRKYPRSSYLVGVGLADDKDTARERARGELARIFSSLVSVEVEGTTAETNGSFSNDIRQKVRSTSKKMLEGVEIVEEWKDDDAKTFYALAVLDREKSRGALVDRLRELDKEAVERKAQLDSSGDKLGRVKASMKLLALLRGREELNSELRVLDAGGQGLPSPLDAGKLRAQAAKALAELDVAVDLRGAKSDEVESGVVQGLTGLGLEAVPGASSGDVVIEGSVVTKRVEGADPRWKFARSAVVLSLKDGKSGKVFLRLEAADRQAATVYDEAARRSLAGLGKKLAPQVHEAVTKYFESQ